MRTYSKATQAALDLAKRNLADLQKAAWISINQFGYPAQEVIVICAELSTEWSKLILELNPSADKAAAEIIAQGMTPITIMCTTINDLSDYLVDTPLDVGFPPPPAEQGRAHLLMLTAGGHCTWIHILPRSYQSQLS